jgi:chitodextrinase
MSSDIRSGFTVGLHSFLTSGSFVLLILMISLLANDATGASAQAMSTNTIRLTWKAPGDDQAEGSATVYDIRYSLSAITESNWGSATQVEGEPAPQTAGTIQTKDVSQLTVGTEYYFAIKAADEAGNWSNLLKFKVVRTLAADQLIVTPETRLNFAEMSESVSTPQTLIISHSDNLNIPFTVTKKAAWLNLSSVSGTTPDTVTVWANSAGLGEGIYWDSILVSSSQNASSPISIEVRFIVTSLETAISEENFPHAFPNPFRTDRDASATFTGIPAKSNLLILSVSGEVIRRWSDCSGQDIKWDGTNESGHAVATGVYLWYVNDGAIKGQIYLIR